MEIQQIALNVTCIIVCPVILLILLILLIGVMFHIYNSI